MNAARAETDLDLSEAIDAVERVDWADVPTVSTAEAAAFNQRLREARDALREDRREYLAEFEDLDDEIRGAMY